MTDKNHNPEVPEGEVAALVDPTPSGYEVVMRRSAPCGRSRVEAGEVVGLIQPMGEATLDFVVGALSNDLASSRLIQAREGD